MATVQNIKATSYSSFGIGKKGVTIYQGASIPDPVVGNDGDLYIYKSAGNAQTIYIKRSGTWTSFQVTDQKLTNIINFTLANNTFVGSDGTNLVLRDAASSRTALGLGTAATLNTGTSAGQVPVLDAQGKLSATVIPARALVDVYHVADQNALNALTVEAGDVAIRNDNGYTYIYDGSAWNLLATTNGVMGIQTVSGTPKNGVISLDAATDIISGILPTTRGGTGLATYAAGDILVGAANGTLGKLGLGTSGQILTSNGTTAVWGSAPASNITFTSSTEQHISATDVQSAIVEVAAERPFIKTSTTNPSVTDDSANFKVGDIWVNTAASRIWFCIDNTASAAIWSESTTSILPTNVRWVAKNGGDTLDGSINRPWATLQHAIDTVANGSVIIINAGTYSENVTLDGKNDVQIIAMGATLDGRLTIQNASGTKVQGLRITNNTTECVSLADGAGNTILDGVVLDAGAPDQNAILLSNSQIGNTLVKNSTITGRVSNNQTTGYTLVVDGCSGSTMRISAGGGITVVSNAATIGSVYHSAGHLLLNGIGIVATNSSGVSIQSIADANSNNSLRLQGVSVRQTNGTYGKIDKTGTSVFAFVSVERDINETYTGTRIYAQWADDISANYSASNYPSTGSTVKDHLEGIDTRLGELGTFQQLTDAADYNVGDANKVVKVNADGTGIDFGVVLGDIATHNVAEFATSAQGAKADSAVQPADLSNVALAAGGRFTNLYDVPSDYTGNALKVVRVNSDASALEFGVTLATVANTGSYNDLINIPSLGSAAGYDAGNGPGQLPILDGSGKLDNSVLPPLALTDVYVVDTIVERNVLQVQGGDVAKVVEDGKTYMYDGVSTWLEITTPDAILTVNGKKGVVVLTGSDIDADRTATNYTAGSTIKEHLDGIDTKFGTLGTASTKNTGTSAGQIPLLDSAGKLELSVLPARAIVSVNEVADLDARDALVAEEGDLAIVSGGSTYAKTATGWAELSAPQLVQSVNGKDGVIVLGSDDINVSRNGNNYSQNAGTVTQHFAAIDLAFATKITNPLTTLGDLLFRDENGAQRLPVGSAGQVLKVVGGVPTWSNISNIPSTLDDLTDVTITSPTTKQVVRYNGSAWVNTQLSYNDLADLPTSIGKLDDLTDVVITTPTIGQAVVFNGTSFVNTLLDWNYLTNKPTLYSDPLTTQGDLLFRDASVTTRLPIGSTGQVLTVVGGVPTWQTAASGSSISTGTTNVDTNAVANTVTVTSNGKRVANLYSGANAGLGERVDVTNDNGSAILSAVNAAGSGNVDLILKAQNSGQVKIQTSGQTMLTTDPGESITIQPGTNSTGAGSTTEIRGGSTTATGGAGGDILFTPGTQGSGGTAGQVKLASGYVPTSADSVVTKSWVESKTANSGGSYTVNLNTTLTTVTLASSDQVLVCRLGTQSTGITVNLPAGSTVGAGKWFIVKDGKGNADTYNITVVANGSDKIDGSANATIIYPREALKIMWDGGEWSIV